MTEGGRGGGAGVAGISRSEIRFLKVNIVSHMGMLYFNEKKYGSEFRK